MNKISQLLSVGTLSLLLFSCAAMKEKVSTGTIVRDCTGTYLRTGANEDYLVCNAQVLASKKAGEKVSLTYVDAKECKENEGKVICMIYHESKGMIRVKNAQ